MPTTVEVDYLDGEIQVQEEQPATIAELSALIGEDAVLQSGIDDNRYRNKYPRVYTKASSELESVVPRAVKETKTNKDGTQKQIKESPMDHLRKAFAADPEKTRSVITSIAQAEPLYVKGERTGGGGKISQGALDAANGFFAAGDEKVEAVIGVIESTVPGYKIARDSDNAATPESLARGIQALNKHLENMAKKNALSALQNATV